MKFKTVICLVTGVAIGAAIGILIPRVGNGTPHSASTTDVAEAFARRAVEADRIHNPEMADLLERAAFARASAHASETPALWLVIRSQLDHGKQGARERFDRLQAFRRAIDQSLSGASRIADFEAAWQVRVDVTAAIVLAQSTLVREIEGDLEQLTNEVKTEPFSKAARRCEEKMHGDGERSLDAVMRNLEASGSSSLRPSTRKTNDIFDLMLPKAEGENTRLEQSLDRQWEEDKINTTGMQPEPVATRGAYAKLSEEIQKLHEDIKASDLESWLVFAAEPGKSGRLEKLYSDIVRCLTRVQELQQAKYNLWAIQEIHAAEEVAGWQERLGRIDVRLLHPTVSALYSMAYEARMKSLNDRQQRPQAVRRLIQQPKIAIEQF